MKNIVYALILSLFIHILFLLVLQDEKVTTQKNIIKNETKKQHITYVKLKKIMPVKNEKKTKKITRKDIVKKQQDDLTVNLTKKIIPKPKLKKVLKEKFTKTKKRTVVKRPKKIVSKPKTKTFVSPSYTKSLPKKPKVIPKKKSLVLNKPEPILINPSLQKIEREEVKEKSLDLLSKKLQENTLESFLSTPNFNENIVDKITQKHLDLYGDEYKTFTKIQKVFIKRNLNLIGRITQSYMYFPEVSKRTRQFGTNIFEFMLHPNGDISGLKLISNSPYEALDKGSRDAIETSYKDYPHPRVTTKIIIRMNYVEY